MLTVLLKTVHYPFVNDYMASHDPVVRPAEGGSGEPPGTEAAVSHFRLPLDSASASMAFLLGFS